MIAKILGAALICMTIVSSPVAFAQTTTTPDMSKSQGAEGSDCTTASGAAGTMQSGTCTAK